MNKRERRNYSYNLIYRLSIMVLPLVVTPYIARVLSPEDVGLYTFSSTIACYFIMFGKTGLDNYGNRSIAFCKNDKKKISKTFWSIYFSQLVMALLSICVYTILVMTIFKKDQRIYWIQLFYVSSALFDVTWFFYGLEKFKITTIRSLITRALIIVLVFVLVKEPKDLWVYTLIMSASFFMEQLLLVPQLLREVEWTPLSLKDIWVHILPNLKLFIPILALSINNWTDKIMLGFMTGSTIFVAFYAYAENIVNLPKGILAALDSIMLPRISGMVANSQREEGIEKMKSSLRLNGFLSSALAFGIAGISPVFIPWFFGAEYFPSVYPAMALAIVMIPMAITGVIQTQYLVPFKLEHIYILAVSLGALTNIILNTLFIPQIGIFGAVIGTLGAELLVCLYQIYRVRDICNPFGIVRMMVPFLLGGILEFLAVYFLGFLEINKAVNIFIQILAGGLVYIIFCGLYFFIIKRERFFISLKG